MTLDVNSYLNQMRSMTLEQIFGGSKVSLDNLRGTVLISLIVLAVLGVLWCFFGLKMVRVWAAILCFAIGCGIGGWITATQFELEATATMIISIAAGIVMACLGAILYRVGVFLVAWIAAASLAYTFLNPTDMTMVYVSLGIGLAAALLTVAFAEPVIMILTGLYGAAGLGAMVSLFIPIDAEWVQIAAIAVFAVLGIWAQFVMESGKRKKHNLKKAAEIREQHSTENEVEKARAMMENLDSIPEDEEGRKISHAYEEYEVDSQFDDEYDIEEDDDITYIE